jgi:ABC-2 type transport system permease protein
LRSREKAASAPLAPLLAKELREIVGGRALWTMLLLLCPLAGFSFMEALRLYSEASAGARDSPIVASGLSPLDGVLVPTFGSFYVAVTLLFPFVAIRVLGSEKETGAMRLLLQLPYRVSTLIGIKLAAVGAAWLIAAVLAGGSALLLWLLLGGHLAGPELANLLLGHLLYGLLIGAIALFAASISESSATAAIITLAFTIGSWVLDFTTAGSSGIAGLLAHLSLTPAIRTFESGLLSLGLVVGMVVAIAGFCTLASIWLQPESRRAPSSCGRRFVLRRSPSPWRFQPRSGPRSISPRTSAIPSPSSIKRRCRSLRHRCRSRCICRRKTLVTSICGAMCWQSLKGPRRT